MLSAWTPGRVEAQPAQETPEQPPQKAPEPSEADKVAAKELVNEGIAAMEAKEYDKALERYRRAHALTKHPLMLFNIAQAHRLAGRLDRALTFYERYLAEDPNGAEAPAAREWRDQLRATGVIPWSGNEAPPEAPPEPAEPPAAMPVPQPAAPDRTDTLASPGRTLRLTGIVIGATGLVSVAVGGYYTMKWRDTQAAADQEIATLSMDGVYSAEDAALIHERYGQGFDQQRRQDIAYIVGGALIVGGAVTYWLGYRKDRAAQATAWAPVVGPSFTGIAFSGSLP